MENIKLQDLRREHGEFKLSVTGKTYKIRPVTLADEEWLQRKFGGDLQSIFDREDVNAICMVAFRLMTFEDQKDFAAREVEFINEDTGETGSMRVGGSELLKHHIAGLEDMNGLIEALLRTIGISRHLQSELEKMVEEKKSQMLKDLGNKPKEPKSAGEKSSIDSSPNMDGKMSTSGDSQSKESESRSPRSKKGRRAK